MHFTQQPLQEAKNLCWLAFCWGFFECFFFSFQNLLLPAISRKCKQIKVIANPGLSKHKKVGGHSWFKSWKNKVIESCSAAYWELLKRVPRTKKII